MFSRKAYEVGANIHNEYVCCLEVRKEEFPCFPYHFVVFGYSYVIKGGVCKHKEQVEACVRFL